MTRHRPNPPNCRACGDETQHTCSQCSRPNCERHVLTFQLEGSYIDLCEWCCHAKGIATMSCELCGDTLIGIAARRCAACEKAMQRAASGLLGRMQELFDEIQGEGEV